MEQHTGHEPKTLSDSDGAVIVVSAVIPFYNEREVVARAVKDVAEQLDSCVSSYELICVDDGSMDGTNVLLDELARSNAHVVPLHLSRNFGKESALAAGIDASRGRAVVLIDGDLQHPPNLIPQMVERWRGGVDVVEACKLRRGRETLSHRLLAAAFYRTMGISAGDDLRGSSDYKLLDRQVVDALRSLPERARFFRGLVAWVGFRHERVEFEVQRRAGGTSRWTRRRLLGYAVGNVFAFSTVPLLATAWAGVLATAFAVLLAADTLFNYLRGQAVSGFTTVIIAIALFAGITLLGMGVLAVYLAIVLEEVKSRPVYIIRRPMTTTPDRDAAGDATPNG